MKILDEVIHYGYDTMLYVTHVVIPNIKWYETIKNIKNT
uniref:Uncharacterized protein n=1 Tax=Pyramimonas orientalis virus TaxID=455367 RepID=A0A7M3UP36_POV01|nr:hypothetical protein HWQ62_00360 [Pyramimonas orientalis virus]